MNPQTGAPRDAFASGDEYISIRKRALDELGSWESAGVFQRLGYLIRTEGKNGEWRASLAEVADGVWLSLHRTRKALDHLRTVGWIDSRPTSVLDSTLIWRLCWREETPSEVPHPGDDVPGHPLGTSSAKGEEVPQPSFKSKNNYKTHASADASEIQRVITHHGDLVHNWAEPPRVTAATERVAARLIEKHGLDAVISLITWAQNHEFWRTRTATLSQVAKHAPKMREQRRTDSKGTHRPEVSAGHREQTAGLF
jgi:hypothetical protein